MIRWLHPDKGLISPLEFLPIIEGSELENSVDNWVINEALKQLDLWHKQGIKLESSVLGDLYAIRDIIKTCIEVLGSVLS